MARRRFRCAFVVAGRSTAYVGSPGGGCRAAARLPGFGRACARWRGGPLSSSRARSGVGGRPRCARFVAWPRAPRSRRCSPWPSRRPVCAAPPRRSPARAAPFAARRTSRISLLFTHRRYQPLRRDRRRGSSAAHGRGDPLPARLRPDQPRARSSRTAAAQSRRSRPNATRCCRAKPSSAARRRCCSRSKASAPSSRPCCGWKGCSVLRQSASGRRLRRLAPTPCAAEASSGTGASKAGNPRLRHPHRIGLAVRRHQPRSALTLCSKTASRPVAARQKALIVRCAQAARGAVDTYHRPRHRGGCDEDCLNPRFHKFSRNLPLPPDPIRSGGSRRTNRPRPWT